MKIQNLSLHFHSQQQKKKIIFNRLNFNLPDLGMIVITGDSGVGKSSLLKVIAKVIQPKSGQVILPPSSKLFPPIFLSDQLQLVPDWKVCDYLLTRTQKSISKNLGFTDEDFNKTYQQLSVGQQVRLKVMVLLQQPASVYLLDEPTHALDEMNRKNLIEFLVKQSCEKLIFIATHDQVLIQNSTIEINLQSSFKNEVKFHQNQSCDAHQHDVHPKQHYLKLWKKWFHKLEKIHRSNFMGGMISFGIWIIQIALFLSIHFTFQIQNQMDQYKQLVMADPWLEVVETQNIPIHESPFQLVKTLLPNQSSFKIFFDDFPEAKWVIDIAHWFPQTLKVNNLVVRIRFVDLPFDDQHITTAWIYPKEILPQNLSLSTLSLPNFSNTLTYGGPIRFLYHRSPSTWFEPNQLLLSYWQWLGILTHQETLIDDKISNFLNAYLMFSPPEKALIFHPNQNQKKLLLSLSDHPWRFTIPTEKAYPLIMPLMKPLLNLLPMLSCCLILIWIVLWWSRLHWIYQQYHQQWQWMIAFHQAFQKIWFHMTQNIHFHLMLIHGITITALAILLSVQSTIPMSSRLVILPIQISIWFILETLKVIIRRFFYHA